MTDSRLTLKSWTWGRDTNGLFDYDCHLYTKNKLKLSEDCQILRVGEKVTTITSDQKSSQPLSSIHKTSKFFYLNPQTFSTHKPWLVIKSIKPKEYLLSEGDKLKIGKISLKIKEISGFRQRDHKKVSIHSKSLQNGGIGSYSKHCKSKEIYKVQGSSGTCRICLCEESTNDDQLMSLCSCSGTMGLTHTNCLKNWLSSKITSNIHKNIQVYEWKSFHCELCGFKYPRQIQLSGNAVDLVAINKPLTDYVVIRSGSKDSKLLHVVSLENRKIIKFGRSNDCDLKFKDISVSRSHALVHVKANGIYLEDMASKFGTMVRIRKNIAIDPDFPFKVQVGRTLLKFSVCRTWSLFACFSGCGKEKDSDEEVKNSAGSMESFS